MTARLKLLLDTNIIIDYLSMRQPFYQDARLLMIAGRVGEFDLWITSSQMTDLVYILSDGGRAALMPSTLERLRGMRTFVEVFALGAREIDGMLATGWKDPEDALLFEAALNLKADYLISRNQANFESSLVPVVDCAGFFERMKTERDLDYAEIDF